MGGGVFRGAFHAMGKRQHTSDNETSPVITCLIEWNSSFIWVCNSSVQLQNSSNIMLITSVLNIHFLLEQGK